jgi:hypothetical protein
MARVGIEQFSCFLECVTVGRMQAYPEDILALADVSNLDAQQLLQLSKADDVKSGQAIDRRDLHSARQEEIARKRQRRVNEDSVTEDEVQDARFRTERLQALVAASEGLVGNAPAWAVQMEGRLTDRIKDAQKRIGQQIRAVSSNTIFRRKNTLSLSSCSQGTKLTALAKEIPGAGDDLVA